MATKAQNDSRIEVSLERGTIESHGRRALICDVALQLTRGKAATLFELACELQRTLPLRPAVASKVERGYALLLDGALPPFRAKKTVSLECRHLAAASVSQHRPGLPPPPDRERGRRPFRNVQHRTHSPDAGRHPPFALRTETLCTDFARDFVTHWNGRWRALGGVLGEARNCDVFEGQMLPPLVAAFPDHGEIKLLNKAVERQRSACHRRVREEIRRPAYARLVLEFLSNLFSPPFTMGKCIARAKDGQTLSDFAAHRLARLSDQATALARQLDKMDASERHQMRIAFKKLRYALEFFTPLFSPKRRKPYRKELELLQDALGQMNDLAVEQTLVNGILGIKADGLVAGWIASRNDWLLRALPEKMNYSNQVAERFDGVSQGVNPAAVSS